MLLFHPSESFFIIARKRKKMKYLITILTLVVLCSGQTQAQTWESYYLEFRAQDDFFHQDMFVMPEPSGRFKSWAELKPKARRAAKGHIRTFYGVTPSGTGYIGGAIGTMFKSVGRVVVYVVVSAGAAILVGTLINQPARSF